MREIRLSGSEGGGPQTNAVSLPPIKFGPYFRVYNEVFTPEVLRHPMTGIDACSYSAKAIVGDSVNPWGVIHD